MGTVNTPTVHLMDPPRANLFSGLVACDLSEKDPGSASFKNLARLLDVSSFPPPELLLGLNNYGLQIIPSPSKRPRVETKPLNSVLVLPTLIIILFSETRGRAADMLFIACSIDPQGIIPSIRSTFLRALFPVFKSRKRSVTILANNPLFHFLRCGDIIQALILNFLASVKDSRIGRPGLITYCPCRGLKTYFGFLKYCGPRLLPASRQILLDQDGYQITHIGQGAFAMISRVLYRPTGEVRVMKRITFDDTGLAEYLVRNEVNTLKAVAGSLWLPPLLNDFAEGGQFVVTIPYYRRGDLAEFIKHKRYLGPEVAQFYSAQLVLAIQSLHKVGIIHRDIKPDNIFLDEEGHLVLADFGLAENIATIEGGESVITNRYPEWAEARSKNDDNFPFLWVDSFNPLSTQDVAGTFWYTAPEVFRKERYSFGVDYWSVGVIYHELITGHIPFNNYEPYPEDKQPKLDFRPKQGQLKHVDPWRQGAISELIAPSPSSRPKTLSDIKTNRIFNGVDWIAMSQKHIPPPSLPSPLKEDLNCLPLL